MNSFLLTFFLIFKRFLVSNMLFYIEKIKIWFDCNIYSEVIYSEQFWFELSLWLPIRIWCFQIWHYCSFLTGLSLRHYILQLGLGLLSIISMNISFFIKIHCILGFYCFVLNFNFGFFVMPGNRSIDLSYYIFLFLFDDLFSPFLQSNYISITQNWLSRKQK